MIDANHSTSNSFMYFVELKHSVYHVCIETFKCIYENCIAKHARRDDSFHSFRSHSTYILFFIWHDIPHYFNDFCWCTCYLLYTHVYILYIHRFCFFFLLIFHIKKYAIYTCIYSRALSLTTTHSVCSCAFLPINIKDIRWNGTPSPQPKTIINELMDYCRYTLIQVYAFPL